MLQNAILVIQNQNYLLQFKDNNKRITTNHLKYALSKVPGPNADLYDLIFALDLVFGESYTLEPMTKHTYYL